MQRCIILEIGPNRWPNGPTESSRAFLESFTIFVSLLCPPGCLSPHSRPADHFVAVSPLSGQKAVVLSYLVIVVDNEHDSDNKKKAFSPEPSSLGPPNERYPTLPNCDNAVQVGL